MAWYHTAGAEQDTVLASCVCFSRNLEGYPFPSRLDAAQARDILSLTGEALEKNGFTKTDFADISRAMAYALAEQHYVTASFIKKSLPHALFLNEPCHLSATVCGEDHVKLQCLLPGAAWRDAHKAVSGVERLLDEKFSFAFDPQRGYLTASVSDAGTAMEISAVLFLPLMAEEGRPAAVSARLSRMGMDLRSLYGEEAGGHLYRIVLPSSATVSEAEGLERMTHAVKQLSEMERGLRSAMVGQRREQTVDRVKRAEGLLRYAHFLSVEEFLRGWSDVRLGVIMGIIQGLPLERLTELLISALPANLTLASPTPLGDDGQADRSRAKLVQEKLNASN